jgi:hypothetical protein
MLLPVWVSSLPRLSNWELLYDSLVTQTQYHIANPIGNNFAINDPYGVWDNLYDTFLIKAQEIIGPFTLLESNKRTCWCYPSNNEYYRGGIHNHKNSSVINAVYYFSVPITDGYRDGAISFYDATENEIWTYKPREQDLLLFPNYLKHQPLPTSSKNYRFSINMEIMCNFNKEATS